MSLLHTETELEEMTDMHDSGRDREISLGTSTLLGVFFALALVCSAFFGFGYSLGRKSAQTVAGQTVSGPVADSGTLSSNSGGLFRGFKPSPGSPAKSGPGTVSAASAPDADGASNPVVVPVSKTDASPVARKTFDPDAQVVGDPAGPVVKSASPAPVVRQTPAVAFASPAVVPGGTSVVQVAAVSHQEDADTLLTMLRRKGYSVAIRSETQDKLLHVQLGPYASKKDAEAMQKRLEADGYHSIVK